MPKVGWLWHRAATGQSPVEEPDFLQGADRTPNLCLGQAKVGAVRIGAEPPAEPGPEK